MKQQFRFLLVLLVLAVNTSFAQTLSEDLGDSPFHRQILLADGEMHKLEIGSKGVFLDGKLKASAKGTDGRFQVITPLSETQEYWNASDDYYKNGSNGIWFLFGTSMATGMCGMPNFAVAYIDSKGNVRLSAESPSACIGDWPSLLDFRFVADSKCENGYPVWKLSNALEFNGCSFTWKVIQRKPKLSVKKS